MDNIILTEAFKELKLLDEEAFDINSSQGVEDAKDFLEDEISINNIDVVDMHAEEEDEILDSYIGQVVLECNVCHSKIFEEPENVEIDEETQTANIEEECPYCFSNDGYKVIGQVAPFGQVEEEIEIEEEIPEEDVTEEPENVEEAEEEIVEESLNEGCKGKNCMKKGNCKNDALEECDKIISEEACPKCGKHPCECEEKELEEDFKDVSITTDDSHMTMTSDEDGKVTVTTEPIRDEFEDEFIEDEIIDDGEEMLAPVDDETVAEIKDEVEEEPFEEEPEEDELDVDIDEFDDEGFDELGESYLRKVYENVNSFKTTNVRESKNKICIEGLINFKSGNTKKTSFIFEAKDIDSKGKIRFIGENKEITRGKKSFTVSGRMNGKKFMCESFNYNYRAKNEKGKSTRLYGTIKKS